MARKRILTYNPFVPTTGRKWVFRYIADSVTFKAELEIDGQVDAERLVGLDGVQPPDHGALVVGRAAPVQLVPDPGQLETCRDAALN